MNDPERQLARAVARAVEAAANRLLAMDPDTADKLAEHEGRTVALHVTGPEVTLYLTPGPDGLRVAAEGEAETTLRGTPGALFASAVSEPSRNAAGRIHIEGDAHLGQAFEQLVRRLRPDWEEPLARAFGDVAGPRIARALRRGVDDSRSAAWNLGEQLSEYLREESRLLVTRPEMDEFVHEVDRLREAVDRLEARLERLTGAGGTPE